MKTFVRGIVVESALLLVSASFGAAASSSGRLSKQGRLHVVELSGSPRERGVQHGQALRREISDVLALWRADLARSTNREADAVVAEFLEATRFMPAIEKWTPGLLEEVRGLAEGAGQPFDAIFAFQLLDELWVYLDRKEAHHCSSLGVPARAGRPAFVAQNMDLESFRDGYQVMLHIAESADTPEQWVFTCAGLIATNGLNRHRIGLVVNTLMQLRASTDGLPVAFVIRGVLAQREGSAAKELLRRVPHASGQNYILGVGDTVEDLEASAGKVVVLPPAANGTVVHTNHPLVNDDWKPWHRAKRAAMSPEQREATSSVTRLSALERRIGRQEGAIDAPAIKATLQSRDSAQHPVCAPVKPNAAATFGGVVMTLGAEPAIEVTAGPPDRHPFTRFTFRSAAR